MFQLEMTERSRKTNVFFMNERAPASNSTFSASFFNEQPAARRSAQD